MSDGVLDDVKKAFPAFLGAVALACVGLASYVILNTISKPYWIAGNDFQCGTDSFHTYYVVNPGPWKNRSPAVEFLPQPGASVVDSSPGVAVDSRPNKLCVHPDNGLPPGCAFFLVYKHSISNAQPTPAVVCDGKPCKVAPSFDLDMVLTLLLCGGLFFLLVGVIFAFFYWRAAAALKAEKESTVRGAVEAFLTSQIAPQIVANAARDAGKMKKDEAKLAKAAKSRAVNGSPATPNNKKS